MLSPAEWLSRVGFSEGNPFSLKWADREHERLHEYFIEHHAYHEVIDVGAARSSILHAPRGAGKSSTRHMFEAYCQAHDEQLRPLMVRLTNWTPIVERVTARRADQQAPLLVSQHDLLEEVLRLFVEALADLPAAGPAAPLPSDAAGYLAWICDTHTHYLSPSQREVFAKRGWTTPPGAPVGAASPYSLEGQPVLRSLKIITQISAALGRRVCYVVIDGVDELYETVADWDAGVSLLAPLIGNIQLLEIPGLAFKCFVPTEIVKTLRARGLLREDRIATIELSWTPLLLRELLRSRLEVFSDGAVQSLAMVATPDLADIDEQLCAAAGGSPRRLLNLGDRLLQICARSSDDSSLLLRPAHLREALAPEALVAGAVTTQAAAAPPAGVPPLRLDPDGTVWRGDVQVEEARRLTPLQRELLSYLYQHRGRLCSTEELINSVWKGRERPSDKDSLRRLADRLVELIEPDPRAPVYLERPYGGYYVLQHAAGASPQDPSKIPG